MKHSRLLFTIALTCIALARAQSPVADWIPVNVGDRWIYSNESLDATKGGGIEHPYVERWTTEETVESSVTIPEGTLVVRRVRTIAGKPPSGQADKEAWLIHGNCLYDLDPGEWNASQPNQLTADFVSQPPWSGGEHPRVFCFPMELKETWGTVSGHEWRVVGTDTSAPDKGQTFHVLSYIGSGLTEDVWLEKGIGFVGERDVHQGTYEEGRARLLRFEPAVRH